jgi:SHS2 domain-containing protein
VHARSLECCLPTQRARSPTITDHSLVVASRSTSVELSATAVDLLLVDWLNDLIIVSKPRNCSWHVNVSVMEHAGAWTVRGSARGERLDPARHPIRTAVKAPPTCPRGRSVRRGMARHVCARCVGAVASGR